MATADETRAVTTDGARTWMQIGWTEIGPDGDEQQITGDVWAAGPTLAGMRTWWVMPHGGGAVLLVARASRRHRVGRAIPVDHEAGTWFRAGTGRYVDVGEYFRESDPRSRFNRTFTPPTHVTLKPMGATARTDLELFERLCVEAEAERD